MASLYQPFLIDSLQFQTIDPLTLQYCIRSGVIKHRRLSVTAVLKAIPDLILKVSLEACADLLGIISTIAGC
ncbi:MAG: hypothetical protein IIB03_00595 [Acidobacteria bacterium]|nr:hypothetical protein [Acidobacteriota bacterium]